MGATIVTDLMTKPALLEALKKAATTPQTPEEIHKQRVSFIMGMLKEDSTVTRAKVSQVLAAQEGRKSA